MDLDWNQIKAIADFLTKTENPNKIYHITENALLEKYGVDLESFHEIANDIFQLIDFNVSPLTQKPYIGIGTGNIWLAKKEIEQKFIHAILSYASVGKFMNKDFFGHQRTITFNEIPRFKILILNMQKKPMKPQLSWVRKPKLNVIYKTFKY